MIVSSPATWAIMRCVCSNLTPPTSLGILYQDPNEVGQSGTESPASLLVTRAPAMMRRNVQVARTTASLWCPRLYGMAIAFRIVPLDSRLECSHLCINVALRAQLLRSVPRKISGNGAGCTARATCSDQHLNRRIQRSYSPAPALKVLSTVFVSLGATVTFWSCSPSFSWTKAIV